MNKEIEYLKSCGHEDPLNFEALNALKQLRELAEQPFDAPEPFKSVFEKSYEYATGREG
jgi:hypothetical protein